jgi:hypothetical protein
MAIRLVGRSENSQKKYRSDKDSGSFGVVADEHA